ncbi:hypothetical protein [Leifsonia shinshuensis]
MIDLDRINVDAATWAAERIHELHPLPDRRLSETPAKEADAWLRELHRQLDAYLCVIGALRRPGRAWVDVQLASHRWVGQWIDDCPTEAAVSCAYWHGEAVIAAGIRLRTSAEAVAAHQARVDSGDLLALLGDEW